MRLLEINGDGKISLGRDFIQDVPPYAILSHTWGDDNQEVTFKDLANDNTATHQKIGYQKIKFCGQQATRDALKYFWVDTCCIDKTNNTELTEAINSMFFWYRNAAKCYVYLSDVSTEGHDHEHDNNGPHAAPAWESSFRKSKWFTRGWTLQELIAPSSVEFFSSESARLGDKRSLERQVHEITGIPCTVLRGGGLSELSVAERMSWAANRQTKREEDNAYCLLGIFDISLPLIYGEGKSNAFIRLEESIDKRNKRRRKLSDASGDSQPGHHKRRRKPFSMVPFSQDPDFIDRPNILAWIHDRCAKPAARAALVGLGGIGKSQIAIQYAYDVQSQAPQTWILWVFASTKARFEESYRSIAQKLALSGWNDPKTNIFQLVASWLSDESNGRWTMVLDSVDDLQVFYPSDANGRSRFYDPAVKPLATYLPQSHHGSILLTSRSRDIAARLIGGYKNIMEVHAMEPDQALQLLETKMEDSSTMAGAFDLLQTLDYIPLAISQAAAYINRRTRITIFGYIDEFNKNHKKKESILNQDAGDLRRDLSSSNSVVTTWQMSFERIRKDRPSAADLLALMSFFNPQGIPESVLRRNHHHRRDRRANSSNNGYELEDEDEDGQFDDDFDLLHAFSLVKVTAHDDMCEMHALVQFCTRVWLSSFGNVNQWRSEFLALMAREFPPGDFDNWIKCQQLLPHVELLHQDEPLTEEALKDWAQVLTNTAWYIWKKGNYRTARDVAEKAFQARSRILGPDDLSTLVTLEIFGLVMWDHGKYDEAETATRQVLQGRLKQLGQQHIDTYASINNLALVLQKQGKYDEAEQMARQAFEGRDRELASHHIDTLTSMDNLALILQKKGNLAEAEEMADRALDGRKKQLGDQHPDTLSSINNLSMILQEQGKYEKAYEMAQQALRGRESGLGRQHPDTLSSMNNVALILQKQGMYEQSRVLAQWAVEGREKELGEEHPDTLTSLGNLAKVMLNQGKYNEAEGLARRVLEGKEKRLGRQHLDVITSSHNLALVLQKQAKYDEAETMTRRALDGYEMALGMDHPNTLTSVYSLAYLLHQSRQFDLASRCYRRAYDGYASKLGPAHPRTVACLKHYRAMEREAVDARGEEKSGSGFDDSDI